jgi:hypothetical protein
MASSILVTSDIDLFGIELGFRPHSEAPSRVFRAMSALIESFEYTDRLLSRSIANRLQPILRLEDIEAGSVLTWLKNTLETVDDEALKSGPNYANCVTLKPVKSEPETSAEYKAFKFLLNRVLAVPHSVIAEREAEYQRESKRNPNKRGPKPKRKGK